jgi:hypothetical protein
MHLSSATRMGMPVTIGEATGITGTIDTIATVTRTMIVAGRTGAAANAMTTASTKAGISIMAAGKRMMIDFRRTL